MFPTIQLTQPWPEFVGGAGRDVIAAEVLPGYLARQRWFPAKSKTIVRIVLEEALGLPAGDATFFVAKVLYTDGGQQRFAVPLALAFAGEDTRVRREAPDRVVAEVAGARRGILHDDLAGRLGLSLLEAMAQAQRWPGSRGALAGEKTSAFDTLLGAQLARGLEARRVTAEQSNTSVIFGDRVIVKLIRRLEPGLNPDYEIGRHLTERSPFPGVPALAGAAVWRDAAGKGQVDPTIVAVAQAFVPGATVLRERMVSGIAAFFRGQSPRLGGSRWTAPPGACLELFDDSAALGRKTGDLHLALADAHGDPAFTPETLSAVDLLAGAVAMQAQVDAALDVLAAHAGGLPPSVADLAGRVLHSRRLLADAISGAARLAPGVQRIRVHGDYQLDQVLVANGEFVIIDFEGEPLRPIAERRAKYLALKDVAGMARSFSYAAYAALFDVAGEDEALAERLDPLARWWTREATAAFAAGYRETVAGAPFLPADPETFGRLLEAFLVEKAAYELRYEINHRPRWLRIPLRGMADLLDRLERR